MPIKLLSDAESANPDPVLHLGKAVQSFMRQADKATAGSAVETLRLGQVSACLNLLHSVDREAAFNLTRSVAATGFSLKPALRTLIGKKLVEYGEKLIESSAERNTISAVEVDIVAQSMTVPEQGRLPQFQYVRRTAGMPPVSG